MSAVVELSTTGRNSLPFQACSMYIVGRVAVLHLDRLDVELPVVAVDVQENLGRLGDGRGGVEGMAAPQHGEIGQRFEVEDVGAREQEEVAQHAVAVPVDRQGRKAIEDEIRPASRAADGAVDLGDELLEAVRHVETADLDSRFFRHKGLVIAEAEVDEFSALRPGVGAERLDQGGVIGDRADLPDDVVSRDQAAKHPIQPREARAQLAVAHATAPSNLD